MADVIKRVQYFDHQFLQVADFTDEQTYHRTMLQLHNANLHTPGVAHGLSVTFATGDTKVSVAPGLALDSTGMEIILTAQYDLELASFAPDTAVHVVISYGEQSTDPATDGSGANTRWTESPVIEGATASPTDGQHLLLATVSRSGTAVTAVSTAGVQIAGSAGGNLTVDSLAVKVPNAVQSNWPTLTAPAASQAELSSALTIDGALTAGGTGAGGATIDGQLTVNGGATLNGGGLQWGNGSQLNTDQGGSLELGGNSGRAGVGSPYIDFHFNGKLANYSARIINDADGQLTIAATTARFTGSVAGPLVVTGGPITPALGNSPNAGIEFPQNPGGGGGDEAYIRYYVDTTAPGATPETTRLQIGIANDADDRLGLVQFGAERLTISSGNVGINEITPLHGFHVTCTANEAHSGGPLAGWSFANRNYNNGALNDNPPGGTGQRWVWYAAQGPSWGPMVNPGQAWLWSSSNLLGVATNGNIGVKGFDPNVGLPSGWGGGVHTFDLYAEATVAAGPSGGPAKAYINSGGAVVGSSKSFLIDHPLDPDRELVHSALEGPEHSVFYRGEARLEGGRATVELPRYFEALCRADGRSVQLTPRVESDGAQPNVLGVTNVRDGSFTVVARADGDPSQGFYWEVKGVRTDLDELDVEPLRGTSALAAIAEDNGNPEPGGNQ